MKSGQDQSLGISMPTGLNNLFYFPRQDSDPGEGREHHRAQAGSGGPKNGQALPLSQTSSRRGQGYLHFTRLLITVAPPNPEMGRKVTCPRSDSGSSQSLPGVEAWVVSLATL